MPHRLRDEDGFSLVELLVAVLILSVLIVAALPILLSQQAKAKDTHAQTAVVTAAKAATAYGADAQGFTDITRGALIRVEKSLEIARNLQVTGTDRTFTVSVDSVSGTTFEIERAADGELTRTCTPAGAGNCREQPDGRGNRW